LPSAEQDVATFCEYVEKLVLPVTFEVFFYFSFSLLWLFRRCSVEIPLTYRSEEIA
jgi:hypothetical protein